MRLQPETANPGGGFAALGVPRVLGVRRVSEVWSEAGDPRGWELGERLEAVGGISSAPG